MSLSLGGKVTFTVAGDVVNFDRALFVDQLAEALRFARSSLAASVSPLRYYSAASWRAIRSPRLSAGRPGPEPVSRRRAVPGLKPAPHSRTITQPLQHSRTAE
jgi:hypothetical protein